MRVTEIEMRNFRNLSDTVINPHPGCNLITGMNAQGKTNFLEAIWLMSGCRSFRGSRDRDIIKMDKAAFEVKMTFSNKRRENRFRLLTQKEPQIKKDYFANDVPSKESGGFFRNFRCIAFTPDDIGLIKGAPEKRRSYIDFCLCMTAHKYLITVNQYSKLLEQRNALLKEIAAGKRTKSEIDVWDIQLTSIGASLTVSRREYTKKINRVCGEIYKKISGGKEDLEISYYSNIVGEDDVEKYSGMDITGMFVLRLGRLYEEELKQGYTSIGPQRDDLRIKINGLNIKEFGSQGQKKTAALAMKLAQAQLYKEMLGESPVVLLDDVMGELDVQRQSQVFDIIDDMQAFITVCNKESVSGLKSGAVYSVKNGIIKESMVL